MDRLALRETPPREAVFDVPDKSIPIRRATTMFPPLNSNSATMTNSSGQTKIEFDLTSRGMIDPYGCYLSFDLITTAPKTPATASTGITTRNKFLGTNSLIQTVEIISTSDGTVIERIDGYNQLAHTLTKGTLTDDYMRSTGSILFGVKTGYTTTTALGNNTYDATNTVPTINYPAITVSGSGTTEKIDSVATLSFCMPLTFCGFFSSNSGKYFPLNQIDNGLRLRIYLAPPRMAYQCNANVADEAIQSYTLANINFYMDVIYTTDPDYELYMKKIKSEGIRLFFDSYAANSQAITAGQSNTQITLFNRHPSVKDLYFCMQTSLGDYRTNPTIMPLNGLSTFSTHVGTEQVPNILFRVGANSHAELRKSFNKLNDYGTGSMISDTSILTNDAIYGINFENVLGTGLNGGQIMSGLDTANNHQPQNIQLKLNANGGFTANATLYTWIHYDYALYITPEGKVVQIGGV